MNHTSNELRPGAFVRHLLRRRDNPLFPAERRQVSEEEMSAAGEADHRAAADFNQRLQALLEETVALKPNEESELLLDLKGRLDHAYTLACSLEGDREPAKQALARLIELIMGALQRAAEGDAQAQDELGQEAEARQAHQRLLNYPLPADLMLADSPIGDDELLPTLLSSDAFELEAALWLFEPQQLQALHAEGETLLEHLGSEGLDTSEAAARLAQIAELSSTQ